jgi:glycosyltransferase involved in cell wall biosynthesis
MKISIIIATYNSEEVIEKCLKSLVNQSCDLFEVIIIDGDSSDNTKKIIKNNNNIVSYFSSEPDSGIYDAWNKGLEVVSTDWVMFLGSDDILVENSIEKYIDFIRLNESLEYVSAKSNLVDNDGKIIKVIGEKWKFSKFKRFMTVCHTSSIQRMSLFKKYGNFNSSYKIAGDYEFLLRPRKDLRAGFINYIMCDMRIGGVSNSMLKEVLRESFQAKKNTGKVNVFLCLIDYFRAYLVNNFFIKN